MVYSMRIAGVYETTNEQGIPVVEGSNIPAQQSTAVVGEDGSTSTVVVHFYSTAGSDGLNTAPTTAPGSPNASAVPVSGNGATTAVAGVTSGSPSGTNNGAANTQSAVTQSGAASSSPATVSAYEADYYNTPYDDLVALGFLGRVKAYDWHLELIGLGLIGVLVLLFLFGSQQNQSTVNTWIKGVRPVLDENFYQVGVKEDQLLIKDTPQTFTTYASGRVNISGLLINFGLVSRQNYFMYIFESIASNFFESIKPQEDIVEVKIKPFPNEKINNFIFGIVNKNDMGATRNDNYYLSLTKTTESASLPQEFVFMSESTELNERLFTEELKEVLNKSGKILKYLAISDLPSVRPVSEDEFKSSPHLILKLSLKTDKQSLETSKNLIDQLIKLTDTINKFQLKHDSLKKINGVRTNEVNKIKKAIEEQKAEDLKEQKLEEERENRRNLAKLSPEEQDKLEKKQREKRERRARNRQKQRM
ncbi:Coiled-coil domain-containing protein [Wickerhamomyces ciferrii]|uniref:Coiled-coil domain-containing protein n=1 Tax=Wickerhamomyces ciferrii (strain ATCC 14091 / BCRC 22168 / CBS 111 / JCM 3599 / NBRC 0793 / NRRL Y-1031 F-60-10) TaxID=1206466 RepID=K0KKZ2_WICCF|nr:Coiled-coil domain-containing protein [Wickerhamomyces ciferrii]CCH41758.1 Coiled-coil domain-containing protein [Wickerhamomyces ciferrii]